MERAADFLSERNCLGGLDELTGCCGCNNPSLPLDCTSAAFLRFPVSSLWARRCERPHTCRFARFAVKILSLKGPIENVEVQNPVVWREELMTSSA